MAIVQLNPIAENIRGRLSRKSPTVMRQKKYRAENGAVISKGAQEAYNIMNPRDAMEAGIGMVHQEFMLIPGFTITENIKLNRETTKSSAMSKIFGKRLETLDHEHMAQDARKALDTMGMDIEEYTRVHGLPVGHMQFVEIAREIDKTGIRFLVFDEPTAVLTESETEHLLDAIRKLAAQGIGIIFISIARMKVLSVKYCLRWILVELWL